MRTLLLLLALSLATPALAQRGAGPIGNSPRGNDRLIQEALVGLGVRPDSPAIEAAVGAAFDELLPGEEYRRYRLNPTQARAIAWTAVLFAADGAATTPRPGPNPLPGCYDAVERVYDLAAAIPPDDYRLFLTASEKETARSLADDIRRAASACGCLALADAALEFTRLIAPSNAHREAAVEQIDRMRGLAADCR